MIRYCNHHGQAQVTAAITAQVKRALQQGTTALASFPFTGYPPERGAAGTLDVAPGGGSSARRVPGQQRLDDLGVLPDGPGWPAGDGEGRLHAAAEHFLQH